MIYKFNPNEQARKIIRLNNYDYSSKWLYFITISIKDKLCLFWEIKNNELFLNDAWKMVEKYWLELGNKFKNIKLHNFIVMPNHFHWIIEILCNYENNLQDTHKGRPYNKKSISDIVWWFKSITTNEYIKNVSKNNWNQFNKQLWQRSFYDNIIRNEESYIKISEYIINNPIKWVEDKFYFTEM